MVAILAVVVNDRMVQARSILSLCQKLTNKGLNIPNAEYSVFDFHNEDPLFKLRYDAECDCWDHYVPAHWQVVQKSRGLKPQGPPKVEP